MENEGIFFKCALLVLFRFSPQQAEGKAILIAFITILMAILYFLSI